MMAVEITEEFVWQNIPRRPRDSHKGTFGSVLAVAGSAFYRGAALLAAEGALRTGAGIVTLASVEPVVSAAAARLLAEGGAFPHPAGELIVTPHPGEMARLTGLSAAQINADREGTALRYAQAWNAVVVLKGARTVVAAPDGRVCVNPTGNPGLSRGGSGDVLAGVITALLGAGLPPLEAAACGAWLHGAAGDRCAAELGQYGMLPTDMLSALPRLMK